MEDLEKRNEELSSEVALLKEQIARMTETLQSLERRNSEEPSAEGQVSGPALTLALSPQALQNRYDAGLFPYGLPPRNDQPLMAQPNPTQTLEISVNTAASPQPIVTVIPSTTIPQHVNPTLGLHENLPTIVPAAAQGHAYIPPAQNNFSHGPGQVYQSAGAERSPEEDAQMWGKW